MRIHAHAHFHARALVAIGNEESLLTNEVLSHMADPVRDGRLVLRAHTLACACVRACVGLGAGVVRAYMSQHCEGAG